MNKTFQLGYGDYLRFRELVLQHSGLHFPEKKRNDLELGITKALAAAPNGTSDPDSYYRFLSERNNPAARAEVDRLINLLTVGETHFFRNQAQFNALAEQVLPALIRTRLMDSRRANLGYAPQLRIWSAGCASGEEAYSIAMLLHQLIPDIDQWRIFILATDINEDALARARQARYSNWSFRESRAKTMRHIYFNRLDEKQYALQPKIRRMVTFARHNLIEEPFPALHRNIVSMDLIFCRNVTIYFPESVTQQLVDQFYDTLQDNGWLIVGHSEPSLLVYRKFQTRTFPGAILYQKTGTPAALPDDWHLLDREDEQVKTAVSSSPPPPAVPPKQPTAAPTASAPDPALAALQQGQGQISRGEVNEGIVTLEKIIKELKGSTKTETACLLARAYADKGEWSQAKLWCREVLSGNSLMPEAYAILGMIAEQSGNYVEAIANLKKVIYLDSTQILPHFNLGMLYQKTGQMDMACRSWKNAEKLLAQADPDHVLPDSGGTTARRLLTTVRTLLQKEVN